MLSHDASFMLFSKSNDSPFTDAVGATTCSGAVATGTGAAATTKGFDHVVE